MTPLSRATVVLVSYSPFVFSESRESLNGIYQDYLAHLIQHSGFEPHFEILPMNRLHDQISKGTYDLFIGAAGATDTDKNYLEVAPFHKMKFVLIGLEKKLDFKNGPVAIGKIPNTECSMFNKEQEKKVRYFEYNNTEQAIKMLEAKRVSALCTTRELFNFEIQHSEYKGRKFNEFSEFHYEVKLSIFANKRLPPDSITRVSRAIVELEQKKLMATLYKKYGLEEPTKP